MKTKRLVFVVATLIGVIFIAFLLWPGQPRRNGHLTDVGISVPESAVTAVEEGPFTLKSSDYMVAFRLLPTQIPALIKQMQTKDNYEIGAYSQVMPKSITYTPYAKKFFAAVPKSATGATFLVTHDKGKKNQWATYCFFAIDKATGRVWFYGQEAY